MSRSVLVLALWAAVSVVPLWAEDGTFTFGFVFSQTVAFKGTIVGGVNGGVGFTISIADSSWKFCTEARYQYAFNSGIPTTVVPVTFGFRLN